ncbi:MAG: DUF4372 domain-containing protein [Bacteroidetes bacterium]|nr:DUF4372 domain-containing protein [Bacteroidota bacterium]
MDFVPRHEFHRCVERYHDLYKIQNFSCWDHFLCINVTDPSFFILLKWSGCLLALCRRYNPMAKIEKTMNAKTMHTMVSENMAK